CRGEHGHAGIAAGDLGMTLSLALALDEFGFHPAAWRLTRTDPEALYTVDYFAEAAQRAEAGLLDFVTLDDTLALRPHRPDGVLGRLDATLVLTQVAQLTRTVGLVTTLATETGGIRPERAAAQLATLDRLAGGRVGWRPRVAAG